jgi:drug/metabolite transporter (DMT)-like permease
MAVKSRDLVTGTIFGLATAMAFSISPIFVRKGMAEGFSAEIGLTVGVTAAALSYVLILIVVDRPALDVRRLPGWSPVLWELAAAVAIVTGTWLRYRAMALIPLAIVSALGRVNILVILLLARRSVTPRAWLGGALIIAGTILLSI